MSVVCSVICFCLFVVVFLDICPVKSGPRVMQIWQAAFLEVFNLSDAAIEHEENVHSYVN